MSFAKTIFTIGLKFIAAFVYVIVWVLILYSIGEGISSIVYPSNSLLVSLVYLLLYGNFFYLLLRSEREGFEGVDPLWFNVILGVPYAVVATSILFFLLSVGMFFLVLNTFIFLVLIIMFAFRIQKKLQRDYSEPLNNAKERDKRSVFLAKNTLNVISWAGFVTGLIAFGLFKLGVR